MDPGWEKGVFGIRNKHPGSATLEVFLKYLFWLARLCWLFFCLHRPFWIFDKCLFKPTLLPKKKFGLLCSETFSTTYGGGDMTTYVGGNMITYVGGDMTTYVGGDKLSLSSGIDSLACAFPLVLHSPLVARGLIGAPPSTPPKFPSQG